MKEDDDDNKKKKIIIIIRNLCANIIKFIGNLQNLYGPK